jgi:hypothetical protein
MHSYFTLTPIIPKANNTMLNAAKKPGGEVT